MRKKAGIGFPGWDPSVSYLIAEAEMAEEPAWGVRHGAKGVEAIGKLGDGRRARVVLSEPEIRQGDEPTLDELRAALTAIYGTDYGVHDVTWLSRFTDATRQAAAYRAKRVLASPATRRTSILRRGDRGSTPEVHDAVNLGWKLSPRS